MSAESQPVSILPESECWRLLDGVALGRLVTCAGGQPEIFPVNFAVPDRTVLFRTAEGTKLTSAAISNQVPFTVTTNSRKPLGRSSFRGLHRPNSISCGSGPTT